MSNTPSTDKVRMAYGDHFCPNPDDPAHRHACPADEDFDRWLESVKRQAKAEAWDEAEDEIWGAGIWHKPNPYREEEA